MSADAKDVKAANINVQSAVLMTVERNGSVVHIPAEIGADSHSRIRRMALGRIPRGRSWRRAKQRSRRRERNRGRRGDRDELRGHRDASHRLPRSRQID